MMRLIDADALLEAIEKRFGKWVLLQGIKDLITNAPTVQREGWVSVPIEPTEEMIDAIVTTNKINQKTFQFRTVGALKIYKAMIQAAPTYKELNHD